MSDSPREKYTLRDKGLLTPKSSRLFVLQPFMSSRLKIHDTCGVNNLHGMPGILAGLVGAVMAAMANTGTWGER